MKNCTLQFYDRKFLNGMQRKGIIVELKDDHGTVTRGEVAPLPGFSDESLSDATEQLQAILPFILEYDATQLLALLPSLNLYPSVLFGLESALLHPLPFAHVVESALLMGSVSEIRSQAAKRRQEGYTSAKLKVSQLNFHEAALIIHELKDQFYLRIDVNRAWDKKSALNFFSQFSNETFDYVEEPFKNPLELADFTHPLAIDESFPKNLTLDDLKELPTFKALIFKPTLQGGLRKAESLLEWTTKHSKKLVLSSSFETEIGLDHIKSLAQRLQLQSPLGIGTKHFI